MGGILFSMLLGIVLYVIISKVMYKEPLTRLEKAVCIFLLVVIAILFILIKIE